MNLCMDNFCLSSSNNVPPCFIRAILVSKIAKSCFDVLTVGLSVLFVRPKTSASWETNPSSGIDDKKPTSALALLRRDWVDLPPPSWPVKALNSLSDKFSFAWISWICFNIFNLFIIEF